MNDVPEALSHFLRSAPAPEIRKTRQCLERSRAIQADLKRLLPASLAPHCTAVSWPERDTLLLSADAPAWALRLRLLLPRIIRHMAGAALYDGLHEVRIRTAPRRPRARGAPACRRPRTLGIDVSVAGRLRTLAFQVADPALQRSLERLAGRRPDSGDI